MLAGAGKEEVEVGAYVSVVGRDANNKCAILVKIRYALHGVITTSPVWRSVLVYM